jgi:2-enoate reductase
MEHDVLVLATGAIPTDVEDLTGERNHSVRAEDVLVGKESVGKNVIIAGGGLVGCEIALFLMDRCQQITIIEKLDDIALDTNILAAEDIKRRMTDRNIEVLTRTFVDKIVETGVVVMDKDWKRRAIEGDSVVVALGYRPDRSLSDELSKREIPFIEAGDCVQRGGLLTCIRQAWDISLNL